ncbi:MAG: helix-turn-helix domain-containing protein [Acidimicrobiia bacterium]|nr:helix-turn-helix domain-containing protein [Acidimicrobiia bacterium]
MTVPAFVVLVSTDVVGLRLMRQSPRMRVHHALRSATESYAEIEHNPDDDAVGVEPRALTYRQASVALGISEAKVRELCREGDLPVLHIGRSARVRTVDVDRYLADQVEVEAS